MYIRMNNLLNLHANFNFPSLPYHSIIPLPIQLPTSTLHHPNLSLHLTLPLLVQMTTPTLTLSATLT